MLAESTHLLVVDVETTGPNKFKHWMPCFGAAVVSARGCPKDAQFICYLEQPPNFEWDALTLKSFWRDPDKSIDGKLLIDQLESDAQKCGKSDVTLGMGRFVGWVQRMVAKYPKLQIASDNPCFDIAWIDHYLQLYCPQSPFICMTNCTGKWQPVLDLRMTKSHKSTSDVDHNPLNDAIRLGKLYFT